MVFFYLYTFISLICFFIYRNPSGWTKTDTFLVLNGDDIHFSKIDELRNVVDMKERKKVIKTYVENLELNWNGDTKQHTLIMSMKLPLVNDGISYKKGKSNQYLRDRKGFKRYDITEGKTELTTPLLCLNSLNSN